MVRVVRMVRMAKEHRNNLSKDPSKKKMPTKLWRTLDEQRKRIWQKHAVAVQVIRACSILSESMEQSYDPIPGCSLERKRA